MTRDSKIPTLLLNLSLTALSALGLGACDAKEDPYASKKEGGSVDLHAAEVEMTQEELAAAREAAGHDTRDEIAEENAKMFEKGAQEYIKTRLSEYRDLLAEIRGYLSDIEKQAPKWTNDAKFAKFSTKYKTKTKALLETYDELTGKGVEGGLTQADLGLAVRSWETLNDDLGVGIGDNEALPAALEEIRTILNKVEKTLDEIEHDESLEINELYEKKKKKKKSK